MPTCDGSSGGLDPLNPVPDWRERALNLLSVMFLVVVFWALLTFGPALFGR